MYKTRTRNKKINISKEVLEELYIKRNLSAFEISKIYNCSKGFIDRKAIEFGLIKAKYLEVTKDELVKLYFIENKTIEEIAIIFNCTWKTIASKFKLYGIKAKSRKTAIIKKCAICSKDIEIQLHRIKNTKNFTCSRKCGGKLHSKMTLGKNNPRYRGGVKDYGDGWHYSRKLVRQRDSVCRICGRTKDKKNNKLSVHHKIPFRLFGEENCFKANHPSNLACYCRTPCHFTIEEISQLIWDKDFFQKGKIIETSPIDIDNNFHCYSVYK